LLQLLTHDYSPKTDVSDLCILDPKSLPDSNASSLVPVPVFMNAMAHTVDRNGGSHKMPRSL